MNTSTLHSDAGSPSPRARDGSAPPVKHAGRVAIVVVVAFAAIVASGGGIDGDPYLDLAGYYAAQMAANGAAPTRADAGRHAAGAAVSVLKSRAWA